MALRNAFADLALDEHLTHSSSVEFASAARTTTQTGADRTNTHSRGLHLVINVTAAGVAGITPKVQGKSASGAYYDILVGAAITGTGTTVLKVYPGIVAVPNAAASDVLPRVYRVVVTANDANAVTYSADRELVV